VIRVAHRNDTIQSSAGAKPQPAKTCSVLADQITIYE
jgi:hypothetical protein